jgi:predicted DCC family thiol-disulfide oxidoreductase YuxK
MHSVDVAGDGNCFYRSLSVCLYRHEDAHADIRLKVAQSIADKASCATPDDRAALLRRAAYVSRDQAWPGEDVILATAACLKRHLHIYVAGARDVPSRYSSDVTSSGAPPLTLAFYEPGHYRAVITSPCTLPSCSGSSKSTPGNEQIPVITATLSTPAMSQGNDSTPISLNMPAAI